MSHSVEIIQHPVNLTLKNLEGKIDELVELKDKDAEHVEAIARISQIVSGYKVAFTNCDRNLIALSWLSVSNDCMNSIITNINSYIDNRSITHLTNQIDSSLTELLNTTVRFNCVRNRQTLRGAAEAFDAYRNVLNNQNEQLIEKNALLEEKYKENLTKTESDLDELLNKLTSLSTDINNEQIRLDGFANQYQQQKQEDQNMFQEILNEQREQFKNAQDNRNESFKQSDMDFRDRQDVLYSEYNQNFEEYKKQVEGIVGVLNANSFLHKYMDVADGAQKSAQTWHKITLGLLLGVVAFAVYAFIYTMGQDPSWIKLVAKVFATTTIATGAAYAARQASKQEKVERYARKIEMELVAIDPFINSLDDEKQAEIKEELAFRIFGNDNSMELNAKEKKDDDMVILKKYIPELLAFIGKQSS